jgi:hypothetical protein
LEIASPLALSDAPILLQRSGASRAQLPLDGSHKRGTIILALLSTNFHGEFWGDFEIEGSR